LSEASCERSADEAAAPTAPAVAGEEEEDEEA